MMSSKPPAGDIIVMAVHMKIDDTEDLRIDDRLKDVAQERHQGYGTVCWWRRNQARWEINLSNARVS
jgi:hypothetical protein